MSVTQQLPAVITGRFSIALTQTKFQELQNKADKLIFNEDNLGEIADFLKNTRAVKKAISETHKAGKEESLRISQDWDAAKRSFESMVTSIEEKPNKEYIRLCQEVEDRRLRQQLELDRVQNIKNGIESNVLKFATDIANCTTTEQLIRVERLINLEKSRTDKYQEFMENAITRFNELNKILTTQKVTVRELEENARKQEAAKKANDDEELLRLKAQQELKVAKIEEVKTTVQEAAINQSIQQSAALATEAQEVIPAVKVRRSTWEWEVKDLKELAKKMPEWAMITPVEQKINEYLKAKKTEGIDGEEFTFAGIRFFLKKTY